MERNGHVGLPTRPSCSLLTYRLSLACHLLVWIASSPPHPGYTFTASRRAHSLCAADHLLSLACRLLTVSLWLV